MEVRALPEQSFRQGFFCVAVRFFSKASRWMRQRQRFYFVRVILKITGSVAPVSYVPYRFPAESIVSPPAVVFCENLCRTISLPAAVTSHNKPLRRLPEANPKTFPDESTTT